MVKISTVHEKLNFSKQYEIIFTSKNIVDPHTVYNRLILVLALLILSYFIKFPPLPNNGNSIIIDRWLVRAVGGRHT